MDTSKLHVNDRIFPYLTSDGRCSDGYMSSKVLDLRGFSSLLVSTQLSSNGDAAIVVCIQRVYAKLVAVHVLEDFQIDLGHLYC